MSFQNLHSCMGSFRAVRTLPCAVAPIYCISFSGRQQQRHQGYQGSRVAAVDAVDQPSTVSLAVQQEPEHDLPSSSGSSSSVEEQVFPEMRLQLPAPTYAQVKSANFLKSSVTVADCPQPSLPEFAVIGRSNVGKSSLINMLTGRRQLAMVSKEPGKTRCINHFSINDKWYLVDLPGYGYARTSKDQRATFERFTSEYFTQRDTLAMVLLLVDCSIPPQDSDLEYATWLGRQGLPFSIVFTKANKKKKNMKSSTNITAFKQALLSKQGFELIPPSFVTDAVSGTGKQELLGFIASLRMMFEESQQKQRRRRT